MKTMSEKLVRLRGSGLGSFLTFWLLFVALTISGQAQSSNATLNGAVTDPSGAVVAGAELTLTNTATNFEAKFTTNERGEYTFRNLTPGTYNLKVSKSGFQNYVQKGRSEERRV